MVLVERSKGLSYLIFCFLFSICEVPKLHAEVVYFEERDIDNLGQKLAEKINLLRSMKNASSSIKGRKINRNLIVSQNTSPGGQDNESDKKIYINSPTEFDESLKVTKEAPEELLYKDKKASWYRGFFIERLPVDEGQIYCEKNFGPKSESIVTKMISGVRGTMMMTTVFEANSKIVKHYFECSIPGSILIDDYEENKLDSMLDEAMKKEQRSNSLKKPYDRMEDWVLKDFVEQNIWPDLIASHESKLIQKAKAKITCPKNTTIELYEPLITSDKDDVNGAKDTVVFACVSQQIPIGKICPVGTLYNEVLDGMIPDIDKKTKTATFKSKVSGSCFRRICPSFLTPYDNQCVACPKGTSLSIRETSNFIKKGFFDRPVCIGVHGLVIADEDSN